MTTSSTSAPLRRTAPPARAASPAPVARAAVAGAFDHDDVEFRLNLSDIPRIRESMDVEGLKPTLLSRLLDLVAPIKP
jgi:hypothetical protein